MANPWAGSNTLSAVGVSSGILLDPTARLTNVLLDLSGGFSGDLTVQATLDVWTSTWSGGAQPVWNNISTAHYTSSLSFPTTGMLTIVSPVAGLRLSSSTWAAGSATLKALQEIIA